MNEKSAWLDFAGLMEFMKPLLAFCAASGSLNRKRVCGVIRILTALWTKIQFPATSKCKYELSDSVNSSGSTVKGSQGNDGEDIGVVSNQYFGCKKPLEKSYFQVGKSGLYMLWILRKKQYLACRLLPSGPLALQLVHAAVKTVFKKIQLLEL